MKKENKVISLMLLGLLLAVILSSFEIFNEVTADTNTTIGTVIISISEVTEINFTNATVNFGTGTVDSGRSKALLISNGTVVNGSWSPVTNYLILENIGNNDVDLTVESNATADFLIGGTNALFQWNITEPVEDTCIGIVNLTKSGNNWYDANSSTHVCTTFKATDGVDKLYFWFKIVVPNDANTTGGQAKITATGTSV